MGVFGNHLFKTAVKRNLADLAEGIVSLQHSQEEPVSFGEAVIMMSRHEYYQPYLESGELVFNNWEQCYFGMVLIEAKKELASGRSLVYGSWEHTTLVDLVRRSLASYGGNPDEILNLYAEENASGRDAGNSQILPCPFCQTRIRIPLPPPAQQARCRGCNSQFRISYDGDNLSLLK